MNVDKKYLPDNCTKCAFCDAPFNEINVLLSHMLDFHPDCFFHCDVCGSYVDRSQLIPHMSQHADEEDKMDENLMEGTNETATLEKGASKEKNTKKSSGNSQDIEDNDAFSNSSHSNDRFGPIPDSVFEAIKDTEETPAEPSPKTLEQSCEDMKQMSEKLSSRNVNSTQTNSRVCPICSKVFRVTSSYHYHMKHFHGGVKEHVCNVCGRSFGIKSALTSHLTVHSGEKPYSCPACSKQFRSKASIYIHYNNVHCERKTFACTMCNRSFKWKQKLLRHISSHTKEKKHICPKCNRGFAVKCDLTRHMKTHDSAKPFYCDKCGMTFRQRRYLKQHSEKKHSVTT